MKVTDPTAQTTSIVTRRGRRLQRRLDRADRYFARTERMVEATVARVIAAERALELALADPDTSEVDVGGLIVERGAVPEVLAMAQHDLRVALRRHTDAASRLCHALSAMPDSAADHRIVTSV